MKTKKNIITVTALLFCGLFWQTGSAYGQTQLSDWMRYAIEHSREVKKAKLQIEEAQYLRRETLGQGLPQVEASGSYSRMSLPEIALPQSATAMIPAQYAPLLQQLSNLDALYMASAGIQITQLIYSQSYLVGLKTSKKNQELYDLLKTKTEEEVMEEVANCYYQTFSLILQRQTIEKSLVNIKEIHRIVELNYQQDLVKESSVNRLKVTITNLEVNEETVKNAIDIQLNYLKALAGMPADTLIGIDTASLTNQLTENVFASQFAVENVSSYQVLQKQSELYEQQLKLSRAKHAPTLAAYGQFNYSSYNTEWKIDKMNNMNTIGVKLSIPIFSSGVTHAKCKQSQLKLLQTQETILKTKDLLAVSYKGAFSEYETAHKLLGVQQENKALALKVYDQTSKQYKEGMASMSDVLNVNSDFLQAENTYNQQVLKYKLAEIKLLKSSGNLKSLLNNK